MPNNISLKTKPIDHVTMQSTLTIRELPGNFNVTHFTCTGQNQFGTDYKVAAVVNTGKFMACEQARGQGGSGGMSDDLPETTIGRRSSFSSGLTSEFLPKSV